MIENNRSIHTCCLHLFRPETYFEKEGTFNFSPFLHRAKRQKEDFTNKKRRKGDSTNKNRQKEDFTNKNEKKRDLAIIVGSVFSFLAI
jgi:hypothetical protein